MGTKIALSRCRTARVSSALFRILLAWVLLPNVALPDKSWDRAPQIVQAGNAWREGDALPLELRRYWQNPGDLRSPMDSASLISEIVNLPLLAALATDTGADPECREDAFAQGLYSSGPVKFFALVGARLRAGEKSADPWLDEVRARMTQPYVVVDALFVEDTDMRPSETAKVFDRIERDLAGGADWAATYAKYAQEFRYRGGTRTKIGNLGRLVVFPDPALGQGRYVRLPGGIVWQGEQPPRRLTRLFFFDASHLEAILRARTGETVRAHSVIYEEYVLYKVGEVYRGTPEATPVVQEH